MRLNNSSLKHSSVSNWDGEETGGTGSLQDDCQLFRATAVKKKKGSIVLGCVRIGPSSSSWAITTQLHGKLWRLPVIHI